MTESFLRLPEAQVRTGLSRSTIYEYMKQRHFPASICLGPRSVGWISSEIDDWIESRISESRERIA